MDKGWYARLGLVVVLVVGAWFALWPSLDRWVPAPSWVKKTFSGRIELGLDIQGGLRLMYEVEVEEAIRDLRDTRINNLKDKLAEKLGITESGDTPTVADRDALAQRVHIRAENDTRIQIHFVRGAEDMNRLTRDDIQAFGDLREVSRVGNDIAVELRGDQLERRRDEAVQQARETIAGRIDELGIRETSVTAREADQVIIVEIPGRGEADFERIRNIISRTARLEFKITDDENDFVSTLTDIPEGVEKQTESVSAGLRRPSVMTSFLVGTGDRGRQLLQDYVRRLEAGGRVPDERQFAIGEYEGEQRRGQRRQPQWRTYLLQSRAGITGEYVEDAFVANDPQDNKPYVSLTFSQPSGADMFERLTDDNQKRRMAIVLDDRVASAPVIQTKIGGGRCQITLGGMRNYQDVLNEARDLVVVLKAGALPAPIRPSNEQLIGPTLGTDSIQQGALGALVGVGLTLIFMLFYYQVAGVVADIAVLLNLLCLLATLAFFEATLTLPGIAGMALTVGMAVDANVLINERIREELRHGKSPRSAVDQGYARAFWSIFDSQLTTAIAAVVLYQYGTGPIRGFAVTLLIGILSSIFFSVFCSRLIMDWLVRGLRVARLRVG